MCDNGDLKFTEYVKVKQAVAMYNLAKANPQELDGPLINEWIYGHSGAGKSRRARDENPDFFWKNHNKWWDGYNGEDVVLIDDLSKARSDTMSFHLKIWGDRYPFIAETKGGSMKIRPKKIVVTSQYTIKQLFGNDGELEAAIRRRFTEIHIAGGIPPENSISQFYHKENKELPPILKPKAQIAHVPPPTKKVNFFPIERVKQDASIFEIFHKKA